MDFASRIFCGNLGESELLNNNIMSLGGGAFCRWLLLLLVIHASWCWSLLLLSKSVSKRHLKSTW